MHWVLIAVFTVSGQPEITSQQIGPFETEEVCKVQAENLEEDITNPVDVRTSCIRVSNQS
jgi:hypothetical protein